MTKISANAPKIGRFTLSHRLGRDSLATIYRAKDPRYTRDVAIELLHAQLDADEIVQQIQQQMLDQIRHRAICALYHVGKHQGMPFLAYEYVEGQTLPEVIAAGGVRMGDRLKTVYALIDAFAALHNKGICHHTLTPARLKIRSDGTPKVLNLGRSLLLKALAENTAVKRGELRYMAPEQFARQTPDMRTDVFRLCLVLFELISGKPAIKGGKVLQIRDQAMQLEPAADALGKSAECMQLLALLRQGLLAEPSERYADCTQMLEAFAKAFPAASAAVDEHDGGEAADEQEAFVEALEKTQKIDLSAPPAQVMAEEHAAEQPTSGQAMASDAALAHTPRTQVAQAELARAQGDTDSQATESEPIIAEVAPAPAQSKPATGDGEQTIAYILDRLDKKNDFPVLSQSIFEINKLTALSANTTVTQIAEVILHDYALSNKLLTLANSAYYGVRVEVTKVSEAIRLLGYEQVRITANGLAYTAKLDDSMGQLRDAMLKSFASGLVSRQLAEDVQNSDAEEAFLCAMFHDTGEHLVIHYLPDEHARVLRVVESDANITRESAAQQILGLKFSVLGAAVARNWNFPESIVTAIEGQTAEGEDLKDEQLLQLSWIARGANELCELGGQFAPDDAEQALETLATRLHDHLHIDVQHLRHALTEAAEKARAFAPVLGIEPAKSDYMQALTLWGPAQEQEDDEFEQVNRSATRARTA